MSKKLAICVPHYKRETHLERFIPHMDKFFEGKDIEYKIFVANQVYPDSVSGFNRGISKNIAYDVAVREGYDYFCFHDIDMVPEDDSCDYSWPGEYPQHLAVNVEQFGYHLQYEEYFGGAILLTKNHVETMNGYSNGYWNWGMEDDDFLYRLRVKNLANDKRLEKLDRNLDVFDFNGQFSYGLIPYNDKLSFVTDNSFTITAFVNCRERFDIEPYLIGDIDNRKFIHSYILSRPGFQMGVAYDNTSCFSGGCYDFKNNHHYMWSKRKQDLWSYLVYRVDTSKEMSSLFINGKESSARFGTGVESPMKISTPLKKYGRMPYYIGVNHPHRDPVFFDGQIALLRIYDRALSNKEITNMHSLEYFENDDSVFDIKRDTGLCRFDGVESDNIEFPTIKMNNLPHRRSGRYSSLFHDRNDIVDTKFVHQKDTSINEKRFINEVQAGLINTDDDGLSDLQYEITKRENLFGTKHEFISFKCTGKIPSHVEL